MEEKMEEPMKIKKEWQIVFLASLIIGLFTHGYMFLNNFPNADVMWNLHADQNMITSGRWLLSLACGISSYYQLPWVIGCLSLIWIAISAILIVEIFKIKSKWICILIAGALVSFPALVSTFSYMYTADGYMLAVSLVCISVYLLKKYKWGFIPAGILLGSALGIYQAYLAFAILLCILLLLIAILDGDKTKDLWVQISKMIAYGLIGIGFYWSMLQVLLKIQGLTLSTYQGINEMGRLSLTEIPSLVFSAYLDFFTFAIRSKILVNNISSLFVIFVFTLFVLFIVIHQGIKVELFKKPLRIFAFLFLLAITPLATNVILLLSKEAFNHLVMRFHWVLFLLVPLILFEKYVPNINNKNSRKYMKYIITIVASIFIFNNVLLANIGYFNMNERYEKTYAYCLRLANRMEETEGYYSGIPVMMIGVVDEEEYPDTDVTKEVTGSMIGVNGSIFLYTGEQYQAFFSHYLNISLNLIEEKEIVRIYKTDAYLELETFPSMNSIKVVDGILYIKTEPSK